jgi:hypothetical protein
MNVSAGFGLLVSAVIAVVGILLIMSGGGVAWVGAALVTLAVVAGSVVSTG